MSFLLTRSKQQSLLTKLYTAASAERLKAFASGNHGVEWGNEVTLAWTA